MHRHCPRLAGRCKPVVVTIQSVGPGRRSVATINCSPWSRRAVLGNSVPDGGSKDRTLCCLVRSTPDLRLPHEPKGLARKMYSSLNRIFAKQDIEFRLCVALTLWHPDGSVEVLESRRCSGLKKAIFWEIFSLIITQLPVGRTT